MFPGQTGHGFTLGTEWACCQIFFTHKQAKLTILTKVNANLLTVSGLPTISYLGGLLLYHSGCFLLQELGIPPFYCQKLKSPFSYIIFSAPPQFHQPPLPYIINAALILFISCPYGYFTLWRRTFWIYCNEFSQQFQGKDSATAVFGEWIAQDIPYLHAGA